MSRCSGDYSVMIACWDDWAYHNVSQQRAGNRFGVDLEARMGYTLGTILLSILGGIFSFQICFAGRKVLGLHFLFSNASTLDPFKGCAKCMLRQHTQCSFSLNPIASQPPKCPPPTPDAAHSGPGKCSRSSGPTCQA